MDIAQLFVVFLLIALTAFFVVSEFAIVKIRSTRIEQLIIDGNPNAIAVKKVLSNLDEYLSACQLGITITSLGLGWLGESAFEELLHPIVELFHLTESASAIITISIAFALITFLHVVVGELAPKTLAIQKAEKMCLLTARPLIIFYKVMFPFIWLLNGSARILTRLIGLKPVSEHEVSHTEDELRMILSESYESGEINQSEYKYVNNIFEFDDRVAKEIMVPRTEMVTLYKDKTVEENIEIMVNEKFTRYPVADEDKDHIIGMVNMKELLTDIVIENRKPISIDDYIRPVVQVIESTPIHTLLLRMQKEQVQLAILVDEYGGTAGLVTVEDIVEEIVGEIRDEFDDDEIPLIREIDNNRTILDGKVLIEEVNDMFGLEIDDTDVDTIGGWILTERMDANEGDSITIDPYKFIVKEIDGFQIKSIEVLNESVDVDEPVTNTVS